MSFYKSTRFKIGIARFIYRILKICKFKQVRIIKRNGVYYEVDLSEGIDLSIFLFGSFQKHISNNIKLPIDAIILDIGANFGSIALPFALSVPYGKVYAFEPTDFAYKKLLRNLELNSDLSKRIIPFQKYISEKSGKSERVSAYSSWRLDQKSDNLHPVHFGDLKSSTRDQINLDSFYLEYNLNKIDLIKIDTDGYELDVLNGSRNLLSKFKPIVIFEISTYLLEEKGIKFEDIEGIFLSLGYNLIDSKSGKQVNSSNLYKMVPPEGSLDIIAKIGDN